MNWNEYRDKYRAARAWFDAGMLTGSEYCKRVNELNNLYLAGRGSFLLPVVF